MRLKSTWMSHFEKQLFLFRFFAKQSLIDFRAETNSCALDREKKKRETNCLRNEQPHQSINKFLNRPWPHVTLLLVLLLSGSLGMIIKNRELHAHNNRSDSARRETFFQGELERKWKLFVCINTKTCGNGEEVERKNENSLQTDDWLEWTVQNGELRCLRCLVGKKIQKIFTNLTKSKNWKK